MNKKEKKYHFILGLLKLIKKINKKEKKKERKRNVWSIFYDCFHLVH